jgi:hypothetical protein
MDSLDRGAGSAAPPKAFMERLYFVGGARISVGVETEACNYLQLDKVAPSKQHFVKQMLRSG